MTSVLPISPIPPVSIDAAAAPEGAAGDWFDLQGLGGLRAEAASRPAETSTLRAVAQQFEALMLGMMMKSMREAKLGDGLFDSDQSRLYQDLFDQQLSLAMAQGRGVGIADMLVKALTPQAAAAAGAPQTYERTQRRAAAPASLLEALGAPSAEPANGGAAIAPFATPTASGAAVSGSPQEFVALVLPSAEAAAAKLGVDPLALVAQAALESNWGRQLPGIDGGSSFNVFGIKADDAWDGRRTVKETVEYAGGIASRRREAFRAYDSLEHGFADYVALLSGNPRYEEALRGGMNGEAFAAGLHRAGYATDPAYSAKLTAIYRSPALRNAVAALKKS